jgi:hypothetical protein
MCVVSAMIDSSQQWGPIQKWPYPVVQDMSDIIRRLAEIDKKLGAKDCFDPKKDSFIQELSERLAALEAVAKTKKARKKIQKTN